MSSVISSILATLAQVIPSITSSATVATVIAMLQQIVPVVIKEVQDVTPFIKNIIAALKDNTTITQEQWDELEALSAQVDAAFDAEADAYNPDGTLKS